MVIIKIMNEFLHGPVWTCEEETGIATDDLPLVHEDPTAASLNREIGELYDSYYDFDSRDQVCSPEREHGKRNVNYFSHLQRDAV